MSAVIQKFEQNTHLLNEILLIFSCLSHSQRKTFSAKNGKQYHAFYFLTRQDSQRKVSYIPFQNNERDHRK